MSRPYDLVVFGGTGAQFAHAIFETAGMGILEPPRRTFVVDADRSFFDGGVRDLHEAYVKEPARADAASQDGAVPVTLPELHYVPPYSSQTQSQTVTLLDLLGVSSLSPLGDACISPDEATLNISQGLYGLAKLGGVLVANERLLDGDKANERFPGSLIHQLRAGSVNSPIVLAGSVAGGTGAGFLLPFLRALRSVDAFNARPIYTFLFLPWFSLQPRQGQRIGPDNARMRRNASQGLEYAWSVHEEERTNSGNTCTFVVGMPPDVQLPLRGDATMRSEPGPLLYYAASVLSGDFAAVREVDVANGMPSGIYALRCNQKGASSKALGGRAVFAIEGVDGNSAALFNVPLEAAKALLRAQEKAYRTLAAAHRYQEAFGRLVDTPAFLPALIFDALKKGRDSTSERQTAGLQIAAAFERAAASTAAQIQRISALSTNNPDLLDFHEVDDLVVREWEDRFLENVRDLNEVLNRTPRLGERVRNQVARSQPQVAARLLVQALGRGLASGSETIRALRQAATPPAGGALALPADIGGAAAQGRFAKLDDRATRVLSEALVAGDVPDSQCIPSPLARARVVDFLVRRSTSGRSLSTDPSLANSEAGRIVLTFAGLTAGSWTIGERIALGSTSRGAAAARLHVFDRLVVEGESADSKNPMRAHWAQLVRDSTNGEPVVAFGSPAVGFVPSVAADEGIAPARGKFIGLESQLRASGALERIRQLYAVFLRDLQITMPDSQSNWPAWYSVLNSWTMGVDIVASQTTFPAMAMYGIGPVPLTIPDHPVRWVTLPKLIPLAEREHILSILAVIAASQAPVAGAAKGSSGIEILSTRPPTAGRLMTLRPFGASGQDLTLEEEFKAGALEILWASPLGSPAPVGFYGTWQACKPVLRAKLAASQRNAQPQLTMAHLLSEIAARADFASHLGLTSERLSGLHRITQGPLAPPILNLATGVSWP